MKTTVLLVDDHPVLRKGLGLLLEAEEDIEVIAEAGDGQEAIKMVQEFSPDVVVMDISMPNLDGISATRQIVLESPNTKVIALSIHSGKRFVENMLSAGAAGWGLFSMGAVAWDGIAMRCLLTASVVGLIPTIGLLVFLVHALPRRPAAALATAAGGAVGIGGLAAHASCAASDPMHVLVEHAFAPVLAGVLLALVLYPVLRRLRRA